MNRRDFLLRTLQFSAAGLIVPTFLRRGVAYGYDGKGALTAGAMAGSMAGPFGGKILVLVNLEGGNDGLNTVVPYGDPRYYQVRPTIAIQPGAVAPLSAVTGLHPALSPLLPRYQSGGMAVVQAVGYPSMDLSHFRGTDIWMSGSSSDQVVETGWLARFFEAMYPDFPNTTPNAPFGLQQGDSARLPLKGARAQCGVIVDSPESFYSLVLGSYAGEFDDTPPAGRGGEELAYVRQVDRESFLYAEAIEAAANAGTNSVEYPNFNLARQLEAVARLVSGGLETPVYLTATGGYDTHTSQPDDHADRLNRLARSLDAFLQDLENQGLGDRVLVMTTSEFGRRVEENGDHGTDHGTAAPHFMLGAGVSGGLYGSNPDLQNLDWDGNLLVQHDYRQLYATVLSGHFGADPTVVDEVLMGEWTPIGALPLAKRIPRSQALAGATVKVDFLRGVSPNPLPAGGGAAEIAFDLAQAGAVSFEVFDTSGRQVATPVRGSYSAGSHRVPWKMDRIATGTYFVRMRTAVSERRTRLVVVR